MRLLPVLLELLLLPPSKPPSRLLAVLDVLDVLELDELELEELELLLLPNRPPNRLPTLEAVELLLVAVEVVVAAELVAAVVVVAVVVLVVFFVVFLVVFLTGRLVVSDGDTLTVSVLARQTELQAITRAAVKNTFFMLLFFISFVFRVQISQKISKTGRKITYYS